MNINLEIKDQVKLNDSNTYVIASITKNNNKTYYYLVDIKNHANLKFCYLNNEKGTLVEIENQELIQSLLPGFYLTAKSAIEEFID